MLKSFLVDTGSGGTILSSDLVEKVGLFGEAGDTIYRISGDFILFKKDKCLHKKRVKNDENIKKGLQKSNLEAFFDA
jgi:hypothetical protein